MLSRKETEEREKERERETFDERVMRDCFFLKKKDVMFLKKNRQTEEERKTEEQKKKNSIFSHHTTKHKEKLFYNKSTLPGTSRVTYQHRTKEEEGEGSSSISRAVE